MHTPQEEQAGLPDIDKHGLAASDCAKRLPVSASRQVSS